MCYRRASRDSIQSLIRTGSIIYWFLRPLSPRRFYFLRAASEGLYAGAWMLAGVILSVAADVLAHAAAVATPRR